MKFFGSLLLLTLLCFLSECTSTRFNNYWPYSQLPPRKVKQLIPKHYEDCMGALDSILTPAVKFHFRDEDSSIAVIEICNSIGGFFSTNWRFYRYNRSYHWPDNYAINLPDKPTDIVSRFIYDGIAHPEAMLRVMFGCYYKYLNNQEYSWENEIRETKLLWPTINPKDFDAGIPDTVTKSESKIVSAYYFNLLNVHDTVNILYNRQPKSTRKSADWYYISGVINNKIQESESINIRIVNIESEFNQNYYLSGKDTIHIGDTITDYHKNWLSRNRNYFDYHKVMEKRAAYNLN